MARMAERKVVSISGNLASSEHVFRTDVPEGIYLQHSHTTAVHVLKYLQQASTGVPV